MGVTEHHLNHCVGYEEEESLLGTGCRPGEGLEPPCWMEARTKKISTSYNWLESAPMCPRLQQSHCTTLVRQKT